jgi:glucose dehydrogenase
MLPMPPKSPIDSLKWYYQITSRDTHDYDLAMPRVLLSALSAASR